MLWNLPQSGSACQHGAGTPINMLTGRRHPCCGHLPSAGKGAGGVGRRGGGGVTSPGPG